MHYAALSDDRRCAEKLIQHGADVNVADSCLNTPLVYAAVEGHVEMVKLLLSQGADPAKGQDEYTPLHAAAISGNPLVGVLLLAADANVSSPEKSGDGHTPLHWAVQENQDEFVQLLLDHGADPNRQDVYGFTPLMTAAGSGNSRVAGLLISHGAIVDQKRGEDLESALHIAASYGHLDVVKALTAAGADVSLRTADARTPMDLAMLSGHDDVVQFLRALG